MYEYFFIVTGEQKLHVSEVSDRCVSIQPNQNIFDMHWIGIQNTDLPQEIAVGVMWPKEAIGMLLLHFPTVNIKQISVTYIHQDVGFTLL